MFATDGEEDDGDPVRCGPGSYSRSGYVPGQICKYDWNDVWDEVAARNRYMSPRVSYLFVVDKSLTMHKLSITRENIQGTLAADFILFRETNSSLTALRAMV